MISTFILTGFLFVGGTGLRISRDLPEFSKVDGEDPVQKSLIRNPKPFGNEIAKLANRLYMADQCGKCGPTSVAVTSDKHKMIPSLMGLFTVNIGNQDPTTCATKLGDCNDAGRHPEDTPKKYIDDAFPYLQETKRLFSKYIYPHMKDQAELSELRKNLTETLVVHLRGTDIMKGGVKPGEVVYLPAPCQYVRSEVERSGLKKILLVTDDQTHPCISYLNKLPNLDVQYEVKSQKEDIKTLMSATNLVLSTSSTFGMGAMLLNPGEHKYISKPVFTGRHECEASFYESRLTEMCLLSQNAHIYEIPEPKKVFLTKAEYIQNDENFAGTVVHKCK